MSTALIFCFGAWERVEEWVSRVRGDPGIGAVAIQYVEWWELRNATSTKRTKQAKHPPLTPTRPSQRYHFSCAA